MGKIDFFGGDGYSERKLGGDDMNQDNMNQMPIRRISPVEQERISKFPILCLATLIYAVFYALCLYENKAGILYRVFTAGTMYYFYFCLKKLNLGWKKDNLWYAVVIELLGISTFLTGDSRIIAWNKLGIFLMILAFL